MSVDPAEPEEPAVPAVTVLLEGSPWVAESVVRIAPVEMAAMVARQVQPEMAATAQTAMRRIPTAGPEVTEAHLRQAQAAPVVWVQAAPRTE